MMRYLPISIILVFIILTTNAYGQTDSKIIAIIPPFTNFPDVWEIGESQIINKANNADVSPGDLLEYHGTITNPKQEDRELSVTLKVLVNGESKEITEERWIVPGNSTENFEIPFVLEEGGNNEVSIRYIFDRQIPGSEHPNHTFYADIHVLTTIDKILEQIIPWTPVLQGILVIATIVLVVVTWLNMKKTTRLTNQQLALTRRELESRLRADLEVIIGETDLKIEKDGKVQGKVVFSLKNNGTIPARKIRVYYKDPTSSLELSQLIRDEDEIKKNCMPIKGILKPNATSEHLRHNTTLEESRVYQIAIWVEYDYADVKDMEFIQIVEVNAQSNRLLSLYDKTEIDEEKKRKKSIEGL